RPPLPAKERDEVVAELTHVGQEVFFANVPGRSGRDVHDAHTMHPFGGLRQSLAVPTSEHVNVVAGGGEVLAQLSDVDVLATAVDATQDAHRRRMLAD